MKSLFLNRNIGKISKYAFTKLLKDRFLSVLANDQNGSIKRRVYRYSALVAIVEKAKSPAISEYLGLFSFMLLSRK